MTRKTILILTIALALVAGVLSVVLTYSIYNPIKEKEHIAAVEAQIIERLKLIREAQKIHMGVNGRYAVDFEELISFIKQGNIPIINSEEIPVTGDSSIFKYDTIGNTPVRDSLLTGKFKGFKIEELKLIPGKGPKDTFDMVVSLRKSLSGDTVYAIQVSDVEPVLNPKRKTNPLKFGSTDDVSTRGNWEF